MNNAPTYGFTASSIPQYPSHPSLHFRPSFQPSPPEAHALPRPSFSHANNTHPSAAVHTPTSQTHYSHQHHSRSSTGAAPRKSSSSDLWGMPAAAQANYVVSQRLLGGGGFAYGQQEEQPMVESSSPYEEEYESDEMDFDGEDEDSYEEENSFDGPLKEEYRGRAWSHGQEQQNDVVQRQQQVIEQQQYMAHQLQQQASADAYAAQARWNAQQEALAAANVLAHQQQQQAQFEAQHQAAIAASAPRDLDRLFHNMRPSTFVPAPPASIIEQPTCVAAPIIAPKPTPSSLPLAPFAAEAVWSLLQNPFSPAAAEKPTSVVRDDSVTYDRLPAGEFGGRDEWTGAAIAGSAPMIDGRWEGVGKKNAGGYKSWEEENWAKDIYTSSQQTPPAFTLDDFSAPYSSALNLLPPPLRQNPYNLVANPPSSFVRFAHQTLAQTLISPTGVMLALWYISRAPLHEGGGDEGRGLRSGLRRCENGEEIAKRVLTLGLAWANKWLDDNTFTNRSWSDVTRIPIEDINHLELLALSTMSFDLTVTITDWSSWIHRLHTATADTVVRASLVEMAEALRDSEDMWAVSAAGQGAAEAAATIAAVEEAMVASASPVVRAQRDYEEGMIAAQLAAAQQQQQAAAASSSVWGEFGQQQQVAPVQHQHQARSHRSASNRTSFPPPPPADYNSTLPTASSAYASSTLPTNFHAYQQQQQQHQAAQAAAAAAHQHQQYHHLPYPSASSARYNGNQGGLCSGGMLPSVQQGFGGHGMMPVGRCW